MLNCGATRAAVEDSLYSNADMLEQMQRGCGCRAIVEAGLWPPSHHRRSRLEEHSKGVTSMRKKKGRGSQGHFPCNSALNPAWTAKVSCDVSKW